MKIFTLRPDTVTHTELQRIFPGTVCWLGHLESSHRRESQAKGTPRRAGIRKGAMGGGDSPRADEAGEGNLLHVAVGHVRYALIHDLLRFCRGDLWPSLEGPGLDAVAKDAVANAVVSGGGGGNLWAQLQTAAGGRDHAGWTPLHAAWRMGVVPSAEALIALLGPAPPHGARRDARCDARRRQQGKQGKQGRRGDATTEEDTGEETGEEKGKSGVGAAEEGAGAGAAGAVDLVDQMLGSVGMFTHETKASKQQVRSDLFNLHQPASVCILSIAAIYLIKVLYSILSPF